MRPGTASPVFLALCALALACMFGLASPVRADTAFTYQGSLTSGGAPVNAPHDFEFRLWDHPTTGSQIGTVILADDVAVAQGVFTVLLDFGAGSFPGAGRWLEIGVRPGASPDAFTTLSPRRPISPSPYAITADTATYATAAGHADTAGHAATADHATTADTADDSAQLDGQDPRMYLVGANAGTGGTTLLDVDFQELASVLMKTPAGGSIVCLASAGEIDFDASGVLLANFYLQIGSDPAIPITTYSSTSDETFVMPLHPVILPAPSGSYSIRLLAADNNGGGNVFVRRPSLVVFWIPTPAGEVGPGPW